VCFTTLLSNSGMEPETLPGVPVQSWTTVFLKKPNVNLGQIAYQIKAFLRAFQGCIASVPERYFYHT